MPSSEPFRTPYSLFFTQMLNTLILYTIQMTEYLHQFKNCKLKLWYKMENMGNSKSEMLISVFGVCIRASEVFS
jgi:hypothetical protein